MIGQTGGGNRAMETATVGKVVVPVIIENQFDYERSCEGAIPADQVRRIEYQDAVVDTGATFLSMPKSLIDQLGLRLIERRQARTTAGLVSFGVYSPARLSVGGRTCEVRVTEVADECPVLIGFIPLE